MSPLLANLSLVKLLLLAAFANFVLSLQCEYSDTQFREQKVDHFGKSLKTFKQQYQIIDDFYKAGGPILFYQGAENDQISCLVSTKVLSLVRYIVLTTIFLGNSLNTHLLSMPAKLVDFSCRLNTVIMERACLLDRSITPSRMIGITLPWIT